ncbi:MAG: YlxR family protein [Propionibacteriaceae bacterium]|nr:YlxR family protein [Propionibacteriaceae bacterium]
MMAQPIRTCVGCRLTAPQSELVRLAWTGSAIIVSRTTPGRGAWIHPGGECVQLAAKKGRLSRAFRTAIPADAHVEVFPVKP